MRVLFFFKIILKHVQIKSTPCLMSQKRGSKSMFLVTLV